MKTFLSVVILFVAACSKPAPQTPAPAAASSNVAALKQLQAERDAPPPNQAATVAGDDLERMVVFSSVKAPSTAGNPSSLTLCATLYDKNGREVAAEGNFDLTTDLDFSGGSYVYAPMFAPLNFPGNSSPLGICPAGGQLWPNRLEQLQGKTFRIQVKFTSTTEKVLTAETSQSF